MSAPPPPGGPYPPPYGPPGPPGPPGPFGPPPPPSGGSSAGLLLILGAAGLAVVVGIVGFVVFAAGDDDDPPRTLSMPSYTAPSIPSITNSPSYSPSPSPTTTRRSDGRADVGPSYFATSVKTGSGTFVKAAWWTQSCTGAAKPGLASVLRGTPCRGSLYGAQYRAPDRNVYVQLSLMEFDTQAEAKRVADAISSGTAPKIRVSRGSEPGHWWSAAWAGNHVLVRQSFRSGSNQPGPRSGTVQTYGDALLRMMHAELKNIYLWSN
ncbi:hypothetical protein [Actinomadura kijaniata]|uniref:hypothetical protein n=1 Tax=Actinomadura kijaniata TaxID=46161 RepID=UPI000AEE03CB|nr:hypothetical protein [Actinomadura kijaniata]